MMVREERDNSSNVSATAQAWRGRSNGVTRPSLLAPYYRSPRCIFVLAQSLHHIFSGFLDQIQVPKESRTSVRDSLGTRPMSHPYPESTRRCCEVPIWIHLAVRSSCRFLMNGGTNRIRKVRVIVWSPASRGSGPYPKAIGSIGHSAQPGNQAKQGRWGHEPPPIPFGVSALECDAPLYESVGSISPKRSVTTQKPLTCPVGHRSTIGKSKVKHWLWSNKGLIWRPESVWMTTYGSNGEVWVTSLRRPINNLRRTTVTTCWLGSHYEP